MYLQAINKLYQQQDVPCENAFYISHNVIQSPSNVFSAQIKFAPAYGGLQWNASLPEKGPSGFEVCVGTDNWVPATAVISGTPSPLLTGLALFCPAKGVVRAWSHGLRAMLDSVGPDTVIITAAVPDRTQVQHIRYAWADWPICSIYNSAHLPALQFWADVHW